MTNKRVEIVRNPPPERKVVAWQDPSGSYVYIPKRIEEGGGSYSITNGSFLSGDYDGTHWAWNSETSKWTPLYEGDQIVIITEEVITL